MGKIFLDQTRP